MPVKARSSAGIMPDAPTASAPVRSTTRYATVATTAILATAFTRFMAPLAEKMRFKPFDGLMRPGSGSRSPGFTDHPTCATTAPAPTSAAATQNGARRPPNVSSVRTTSGPTGSSCAATGPLAASSPASAVRPRASATGAPHEPSASAARRTATGATSGESATWPCLRASSRRRGVALSVRSPASGMSESHESPDQAGERRLELGEARGEEPDRERQRGAEHEQSDADVHRKADDEHVQL